MITKKDVDHVAELARLKLTDAETEEFTQELSGILGYIDEMDKAETGNMEIVSQITGLTNVTRADEVKNESNRENLLANAPAQKNGAILVKKVFE
jgi:aspartyl-tRNA(Asn)/glutamyl-tRNA(Gln) amidotransferase subunit C